MVRAGAESSPIWTPDRRLRVFVSSTMGELKAERAAIRAAVEQLRLSPVMFELGARPHSPRALYRSYLEQSDVFLGIYWQRYGWVAPDMEVSGLEDELLLSEGMPRLMYVKRPAPDMEPRLADLLGRLQASGSASYKPFGTPEELRDLVLDDLALLLTERFAAASATVDLGSSLPALPQPTTPILGREDDLEQVTTLLDAGHRLVTLTGVGGVGKTRLALAVLRRTAAARSEPVAFVDLSGVTDPADVLPRMATATGAREEGREEALDALVRRLGDRPWVLVLDNFEQVLVTAPLLTRLLERCPHLQLLVTSRVLLRLRGEVEYAVRPLAVGGQQPGRAPAVALFEERARAARADFAVDAGNAGVVSELCRRLDGLPLALELAAPQLRLFTPGQLLARLGEWLEGQTSLPAYADLPERQRTLRATVDWSWELLDEQARTVFARLAVFTGPFTVDAATEVCGGDGIDVIAALASLLDHSLLSSATGADGQPAFRMLDTIRTQARLRLARAGEVDRTFAALERHLVGEFGRASVRLHTPAQAQEVRRLDGHVGDVSAVLSWLIDTGRPLGALLGAVSSCWVWGQITGHLRRLPDFSHLIGGGTDVADREAAVLCWLRMGQLITSCRFAEVAAFVRDKQAVLATLEPRAYGMALVVLGLSSARDVASAVGPGRAMLEEATALMRMADYPAGLGYGLSHLGNARLLADDREGAREAFTEALDIGRDTGDVNLHAEAAYHLAVIALEESETQRARGLLRTASRYYVELDHQDGIARSLAVAAGIELSEGRVDRAAELFGTVDSIRTPLALLPWPMVALVEQRWRDGIAEALPTDEVEAAGGRGRARDGVAELVAVVRL